MSSHLYHFNASFYVAKGLCFTLSFSVTVLYVFLQFAYYPPSWHPNVFENLWGNESQPGITFSIAAICSSMLFSE